jgi:carboxypeptidase D
VPPRTNGGPGCSSLEGSFQENGVSFLQLILRTISKTAQPFTWKPGQALPTQNEWSWTNLSSVLYVEQPIGTGFLQQFLEIFKELKGKKFYATGESVSTRFFKDTESVLTI